MTEETKDLCNRLRGIYNIPISDGAGPIDGKDIFTRKFDTPPINQEAAKAIEEIDNEFETACLMMICLVRRLDENNEWRKEAIRFLNKHDQLNPLR